MIERGILMLLGAVLWGMPLVLIAALLPISIGDIVLYLNPLNSATLLWYALVSAYNRFEESSCTTRVTIGLCLFWSALVPLIATDLSGAICNALSGKLTFLFLFDAGAALAYRYYICGTGKLILKWR